MLERGWCKADREVWFRVSSLEGLGGANLADPPPAPRAPPPPPRPGRLFISTSKCARCLAFSSWPGKTGNKLHFKDPSSNVEKEVWLVLSVSPS